MKALCYHGKSDVRIDTVPDPIIQEPTDVIIRVTTTGICGSALHIFDGFQPEMEITHRLPLSEALRLIKLSATKKMGASRWC